MLAKSLRRARALSFIAFAAFAVTSTAASFASDSWPEFRGPSAQGRSDATGLPQRWSETENVRWKVAIHDRGWSTPVVLGNQVWLTTAHPDGKEMFAICVDRETGRIVHDLKLFDIESPSPLGNDLNCYASPSPVIEPGRV
ncbi:MAG TPA: quinonprotein alcohol dehydrogenase, partial [Planctomycetota bacterium]|nr:quinonprotein alcohol dehydrogenase [Planctomycetota bacterium]